MSAWIKIKQSLICKTLLLVGAPVLIPLLMAMSGAWEPRSASSLLAFPFVLSILPFVLIVTLVCNPADISLPWTVRVIGCALASVLLVLFVSAGRGIVMSPASGRRTILWGGLVVAWFIAGMAGALAVVALQPITLRTYPSTTPTPAPSATQS
jgi:hypothetical protein